MNAKGYTEILKNHFLTFYNQDYRLIQDNAPIHKANLSSTWLRENNIGAIDWPGRSPDLNPLETMWVIL